MPWIILLTDIVMCSSNWKHVVLAQLGVSLMTASALAGGSSHYFLYTAFAQAACVVCRLWTHGGFRRVLLLAAAGVLGVAIAAVQLAASVEGIMEMGRSQDPLFKLRFAMHPANLLQLVSPYLFQDRFCSYSHDPMEGNTHEMGLYCTAFGTVALAWLWMRRSALREQRPFLRAVFVGGGVALIMAMGTYGVLYAILAEVPFLDKFKCSCRYIILVHLAMTILASVALADMLRVVRDKVRIPWREQWPLAFPAGISLLTFLMASYFLLTPHPGHPYATQLSSVSEAFFGTASILAATACCAAAARGMKLGAAGIVVLTFLEIGVGGVWQHVWKNGQPVTLDALIASVPKPPTKDGRVLASPTRYDSLLLLAGYEEMEGYIYCADLAVDPQSAHAGGGEGRERPGKTHDLSRRRETAATGRGTLVRRQRLAGGARATAAPPTPVPGRRCPRRDASPCEDRSEHDRDHRPAGWRACRAAGHAARDPRKAGVG